VAIVVKASSDRSLEIDHEAVDADFAVPALVLQLFLL
jgi:hypothetical protein